MAVTLCKHGSYLETGIVDMILAVDADLDLYERQKAEWEKFGVGVRRADTMHEAIAILKQTHGEEYLFIAISEDTVPNFWMELELMRDETESKIFVISSTFDSSKKACVIQLGANSYDQYGKSARENVRIAYELLKRDNHNDKLRDKILPVLVEGAIVVSPSRRTVYVNDAPLNLKRIEFDILEYFMHNRDIVLTHQQIFERVWGYDYEGDGDGHNLVWDHVYALRRRLEREAGLHGYITTVKDVGYRFSVPLPDQNRTARQPSNIF